MPETKGEIVGHVSAINRYPVKSMQGESLDQARIGPNGIEGDRQWGVVSTATGHVLTAKRVAPLLLAAARTTGDGVEIHLPGGQVVWAGDPLADDEISRWLGEPVLVSSAGEKGGSTLEMSFDVDDEDEGVFEWPTMAGTFLDLSPVHLLTSASLARASGLHPEGRWGVQRFRPTVMVESAEGTAPGFVENDWVGSVVSFGDVELEVLMPTIRCSLPTRAQPDHGLDRDLDIFKTLAAHNSQNLGVYANVRTTGGFEVGDAVTLRRP